MLIVTGFLRYIRIFAGIMIHVRLISSTSNVCCKGLPATWLPCDYTVAVLFLPSCFELAEYVGIEFASSHLRIYVYSIHIYIRNFILVLHLLPYSTKILRDFLSIRTFTGSFIRNFVTFAWTHSFLWMPHWFCEKSTLQFWLRLATSVKVR